MKVSAILISVVLWGFCGFSAQYPKGPDQAITPGAICNAPDSYRYPEKIAYCTRNVSSELKNEIIDQYDSSLGYHIRELNRAQFKIDHYIPLCMGGSNDRTNLWPQHESVYTITDPLEQLSCDKMAAGKLTQKDAIEHIRRAKNNLDQAPEIIREIEAL